MWVLRLGVLYGVGAEKGTFFEFGVGGERIGVPTKGRK